MLRIKLLCLLVAAMLAVSISPSRVLAQPNLLADPSFELPITFDGPPFVGTWEGFSGGGAFAANNDAMPLSGSLSLLLMINPAASNTFAGAFQDVPVSAGLTGTFSGWHKRATSDSASEVRIEWRNSVTNTEVSRIQITPAAGPNYGMFSVSQAVPAGADTARVVYAIQSFQNPSINPQTVYVDDTSFVLVPEPTCASLLSLVGLTLGMLRRR